MAAAHGCVVAADRRAMSTASHSRQRKPQRALVAGDPSSHIDGMMELKNGVDLACASRLKNGSLDETRQCGFTCGTARTSATAHRPATNEEAEGIETIASLLPGLTEAVREGRTRHFADITDEGDPEDDEPMVVEGDVMDVRLGRPDSQPEPEFNASANPDATSRSARSETHAEPEAALTWKLELMIAGFDFEKREPIHRDPWTLTRTRRRWWNCVGKYQDELRQVNLLFLLIPPKQARPSSNR